MLAWWDVFEAVRVERVWDRTLKAEDHVSWRENDEQRIAEQLRMGSIEEGRDGNPR